MGAIQKLLNSANVTRHGELREADPSGKKRVFHRSRSTLGTDPLADNPKIKWETNTNE